jgi:hypothetical protein
MLCLFESSRLLDQAEVAVSSQKGGGLTSGMPLAGGITVPTGLVGTTVRETKQAIP